jgi:hypothetical protein
LLSHLTRIDIDASDVNEPVEHVLVLAVAPNRSVHWRATIAVTHSAEIDSVFVYKQSNDVGADGGGGTLCSVVNEQFHDVSELAAM